MGKSKGSGRKAFMKGKAADSDEEEAPAMRQSQTAGVFTLQLNPQLQINAL
jgi:hypothetical protein